MDKSIEDAKNKRIAQAISLEKAKDHGNKAEIFAYTENVNEAVGALLGTRIGDGSIEAFTAEFIKGKAVNIVDKVMI